MDEGKRVRIDRKSSIETEPRTLSFNQIQDARDAALCVFTTSSREEAARIFTEGLESVVSGGGEKGGGYMEWADEEMVFIEEEEARVDAFRDIASAPF